MVTVRANGNGHACLYNTVTGKKDGKKVGQYVALFYIDNPNKYNFVVNIDGDKSNNNVDNLKWSVSAGT